MGWTTYQKFLALVMVVTGSINTLSTKWADGIESENSAGETRKFNHPFFQATCMFFGEFLCFVAFKVLYFVFSKHGDGRENVHSLTRGNRDFNPFILFLPALCDMTATSIMYVGLNLTFASSFQMFRGSVIIFVGLLSVGFLGRILGKRQWTGIGLVIIGLAIVGIADFMTKSSDSENLDKNSIITGDLLIIIAQVITSIQMVVEEKFVAGLDIPPLQAIGWEGIFGFAMLATLQIPFYFIPIGPPFSNNPRNVVEDAIDAIIQIGNNWQLIFAILGTIISIAFFNFAGISVTKEMSATTRMVLDSVRTIVIWVFSLIFLGQTFQWLQLLGFTSLLIGMCLYNAVTCAGLGVRMRTWYVNNRYRHLSESDVIVNRAADSVERSTNSNAGGTEA